MLDKRQICQDFIKTASKQIPSLAWACTTPIVTAHNGQVQHFGTGTLFREAEHYFLITAAHVFKDAYKYNLSLGIGGANDSKFIALKGSSMVSSSGINESESDPLDIGIHRLSSDSVERLSKEKTFLSFSNTDCDIQTSFGVYTIFGYPGVWSSPSTSERVKVTYKALEYTTYQFDRNTSDLRDYKEQYHILLDGQLNQAFNLNGSKIQAKDLAGNPKSITKDLGGISGCSVWKIGDFNVPTSKWDMDKARIVAVQTGAYYEAEAIQATRWIAVNTLINEAYPELRK